ncbi:hypothetical protein BDN70DRAFT_899940 [Pholiota conissans]|uniref:Uncharacterized protein n=1 Tax=Pholiota conissans TaxID=109636 RepID=A0A9P6CN86_9AGAR|nr:hypothetical protein BDN70DRAFT_899940 [Pholiota conissans]
MTEKAALGRLEYVGYTADEELELELLRSRGLVQPHEERAVDLWRRAFLEAILPRYSIVRIRLGGMSLGINIAGWGISTNRLNPENIEVLRRIFVSIINSSYIDYVGGLLSILQCILGWEGLGVEVKVEFLKSSVGVDDPDPTFAYVDAGSEQDSHYRRRAINYTQEDHRAYQIGWRSAWPGLRPRDFESSAVPIVIGCVVTIRWTAKKWFRKVRSAVRALVDVRSEDNWNRLPSFPEVDFSHHRYRRLPYFDALLDPKEAVSLPSSSGSLGTSDHKLTGLRCILENQERYKTTKRVLTLATYNIALFIEEQLNDTFSTESITI